MTKVSSVGTHENLQPAQSLEAMQAYEQSPVFKQEIQPTLQPFFVGEYTTYRCDVKYEA